MKLSFPEEKKSEWMAPIVVRESESHSKPFGCRSLDFLWNLLFSLLFLENNCFFFFFISNGIFSSAHSYNAPSRWCIQVSVVVVDVFVVKVNSKVATAAINSNKRRNLFIVICCATWKIHFNPGQSESRERRERKKNKLPEMNAAFSSAFLVNTHARSLVRLVHWRRGKQAPAREQKTNTSTFCCWAAFLKLNK